MEKNGNRSVQPSAKGLTSDSKKGQDGVNGKVWPRSGRRREPPGGSPAAKCEASRKPPPQRSTKAFDNIKRPKPRGAGNNGPSVACRTETTRLEKEFEAELGSVFLPGSKKQSLNHLLNFVYATPATNDRYQNERGFSNNLHRFMLTRKHKYNKEQFLQANCQFIVNTSGDYKQYLNNPDALVDWSLIEQVNVQVSDFPSCPICLYPPVAAKITRCGHIYCWSCALHYLSLSDKAWRKCPICYESVHKNDLKSVVCKFYKTYNIDDVITFKLMKRLKGSLVAYPAAQSNCHSEISNYCEENSYDFYSKLLMVNNSGILSIINRENEELAVQLLENGECPENCFIEEAQILLSERKNHVLNSLETEIKHEVKDSLNLGEGVENLEISNNQSKFYYFYQASDGQHIYLHAMNARMLEHTYGSLEHSPETITGKILEKEGGSMTEDLRKRLRYLQHLPVTCQFEVAEIQLRHPVVTKDTLECFYSQLELRRKQRQRRAKEEKKREKKIAEEENRLMGKIMTPDIRIESELQFPCFDGRNETDSILQSDGAASEIITPPNSLEHAGPSFAKMLATAKKSTPEKWPTLKPVETPSKLINVTGQRVASTSFSTSRHTKSDSEPEVEQFEPVPSNSLGDAIVQALQKVGEADLAVSTPGKKKKIKNRQKVLFTTTLAYTGK